MTGVTRLHEDLDGAKLGTRATPQEDLGEDDRVQLLRGRTVGVLVEDAVVHPGSHPVEANPTQERRGHQLGAHLELPIHTGHVPARLQAEVEAAGDEATDVAGLGANREIDLGEAGEQGLLLDEVTPGGADPTTEMPGDLEIRALDDGVRPRVETKRDHRRHLLEVERVVTVPVAVVQVEPALAADTVDVAGRATAALELDKDIIALELVPEAVASRGTGLELADRDVLASEVGEHEAARLAVEGETEILVQAEPHAGVRGDLLKGELLRLGAAAQEEDGDQDDQSQFAHVSSSGIGARCSSDSRRCLKPFETLPNRPSVVEGVLSLTFKTQNSFHSSSRQNVKEQRKVSTRADLSGLLPYQKTYKSQYYSIFISLCQTTSSCAILSSSSDELFFLEELFLLYYPTSPESNLLNIWPQNTNSISNKCLSSTVKK